MTKLVVKDDKGLPGLWRRRRAAVVILLFECRMRRVLGTTERTAWSGEEAGGPPTRPSARPPFPLGTAGRRNIPPCVPGPQWKGGSLHRAPARYQGPSWGESWGSPGESPGGFPISPASPRTTGPRDGRPGRLCRTTNGSHDLEPAAAARRCGGARLLPHIPTTPAPSLPSMGLPGAKPIRAAPEASAGLRAQAAIRLHAPVPSPARSKQTGALH